MGVETWQRPQADLGGAGTSSSPGDLGLLILRLCRLSFLIFAAGVVGVATLPGRPDGTAIPGEGGTVVESPALCFNTADCHGESGNTLNEIGSVTITGAPQVYEPGREYELGLTMTGFFLTRVYGFQLAAFFEGDETQAGSLTPLTPQTAAIAFQGRQLLTHLQPLSSGEVAFRWTAPEVAAGPVVLRVASNSANNDSSPRGDHIATSQVVVAPAAAPNLETFFFPQIGVGGQGGSFETELIFVNAGEPTPLAVEFLRGEGLPLEVDIQSEEAILSGQTRFESDLAAGAAIKIRLSSGGGIRAGYAQIETAPWVGGTAVFIQQNAEGGVLYEAGVPASRPLPEFSLAAQFEPGAGDTGLALVCPLSQAEGAQRAGPPAAVTLRLYDAAFELLDEQVLSLTPGEHLALFVTQIFDGLTGSFEGSVTVQSDQPLAAVTLRQTRVPTLTAFPVIEGRADRP